jgi:hypothetical protein
MEELFATMREGHAKRSRSRYAAFAWACVFLLLCLLSLLPASAQTPSPSPSPTPDSLRIKLENEKLGLENTKLGLENEKLTLENEYNKRELSLRGLGNWLYVNIPVFLALLVAGGGLYKYFDERKKTRLNREEERFEGVVKSLGSQYEQERISAAVLLFTFLDPKNRKYRRFHEQVFNLAAGHLRKGTPDTAIR